MRHGYSTGTCATAAAKAAAILLLTGKAPDVVTVRLPDGDMPEFPVVKPLLLRERASCSVVKDAGDDPDCTHGAEIRASVCSVPGSGCIQIEGGVGVGVVTKPGLKVPVGQHAINPVPRHMIAANLMDLCPRDVDMKVEVQVPSGAELAERTLNSKLGILGGISILGTSGRVRPMSNEAFRESLLPQLDQAKALGHELICLVPGGSSETAIHSRYGVPSEAIVQMSNWVGFMLEKAVERRFGSVVLAGHIGKLCKVAGGIFDTHSKVADARQEIMAAYAGAAGANRDQIRSILTQSTAEAAVGFLRTEQLEGVLTDLANQASKRASGFCRNRLHVECIFLDLSGEVLAHSDQAEDMGRRYGWWDSLSLSE